MPKNNSKLIALITFLVDILLLMLSFFIGMYTRFGSDFPNEIMYFYMLAAGCILVWLIIALKFNLFDFPRILYVDKVLTKNATSVAIFIFLSASLLYFSTEYKFSRIFFISTMFFYTVFILLWRMLIVFSLKRIRLKGYDLKKIVFVGLGGQLNSLISSVYLNPSHGYQITGIFEDKMPSKKIEKYYKGTLDKAIDYCEHHNVDEMIISLPHNQADLINKLLKCADNQMIRARVITEFSEYLYQRFSIDYIENIPVMKIRKEPLQSFSNRILKRAFDVVSSVLIILVLFTWLFPLIALLIKLTSKGPIFFTQKRTGKEGETFKCLKFRSMKINGNSDTVQATKNDERITHVGSFLRRTNLDEFPQVFNVLFNKMSLVGPRPHMLKHTEQYRVLVDKYMVRHFAKPGITGWAQIKGFRGETKKVQDMANRAEADIWYIENWRFLLDIKIIFITLWRMFFKKDSNAF